MESPGCVGTGGAWGPAGLPKLGAGERMSPRPDSCGHRPVWPPHGLSLPCHRFRVEATLPRAIKVTSTMLQILEPCVTPRDAGMAELGLHGWWQAVASLLGENPLESLPVGPQPFFRNRKMDRRQVTSTTVASLRLSWAHCGLSVPMRRQRLTGDQRWCEAGGEPGAGDPRSGRPLGSTSGDPSAGLASSPSCFQSSRRLCWSLGGGQVGPGSEQGSDLPPRRCCCLAGVKVGLVPGRGMGGCSLQTQG